LQREFLANKEEKSTTDLKNELTSVKLKLINIEKKYEVIYKFKLNN
jgi:hypothetical protein